MTQQGCAQSQSLLYLNECVENTLSLVREDKQNCRQDLKKTSLKTASLLLYMSDIFIKWVQTGIYLKYFKYLCELATLQKSLV